MIFVFHKMVHSPLWPLYMPFLCSAFEKGRKRNDKAIESCRNIKDGVDVML